MKLGDHPIYATVPVSDLAGARTFYSDVLELELGNEMEGEALFYKCGDGTWLEVYRTRAGVGAGHTEAGFEVKDIENLVAGLVKRGVKFQDYDLGEGMKTVDGVLTMGESKAAWFSDPEGNVIGLFQARQTT
jgi:catechol 2,3-dioxygenase-like lactoylglutathione lyase family enzyme